MIIWIQDTSKCPDYHCISIFYLVCALIIIIYDRPIVCIELEKARDNIFTVIYRQGTSKWLVVWRIFTFCLGVLIIILVSLEHTYFVS